MDIEAFSIRATAIERRSVQVHFERLRGRLAMKTFFKWAGIVAGVVVGYRVLTELRAKASRGLAQAEQVTDEARQAMERTEEALRHTQHAIKDARTAVS
jgi:hypothetical protein